MLNSDEQDQRNKDFMAFEDEVRGYFRKALGDSKKLDRVLAELAPEQPAVEWHA